MDEQKNPSVQLTYTLCQRIVRWQKHQLRFYVHFQATDSFHKDTEIQELYQSVFSIIHNSIVSMQPVQDHPLFRCNLTSMKHFIVILE